jgi:uncharacterized protein (DUF2342 family)
MIDTAEKDSQDRSPTIGMDNDAIREAFERGGMRAAIREAATQALAELRCEAAVATRRRKVIEEAMRNDVYPSATDMLQAAWGRKRAGRRR